MLLRSPGDLLQATLCIKSTWSTLLQNTKLKIVVAFTCVFYVWWCVSYTINSFCTDTRFGNDKIRIPNIPVMPYDDKLTMEGYIYKSDSWTFYIQTPHINLQHNNYLFKSTITHTFGYVTASSVWLQLACISREFTAVNVILLRTEISIYAIPAVFIYYNIKGKVKFTLEQTNTSQSGSRDVSLLFL